MTGTNRINHSGLKFISICFLMTTACNSPENDSLPVKRESINSRYLLTNYSEDNTTMFSFDYDSGKLINHTFFQGNEQIIFQYHYDSLGKPGKIMVEQTDFIEYEIYPVFMDDQLSELLFYQGERYMNKLVLDYDKENRIVRTTRISPRTGKLITISIIWEGNNISSYEINFHRTVPPITFIYELQYDQYLNPYWEVFEDFQFNFIEWLPISRNNWVSMVAYDEEIPNNRITFKNTFSYSGPGYPFAKLSKESDSEGGKISRYGEYKY